MLDSADLLDIFALLILAVWCPTIIIGALIDFLLKPLDNSSDKP